MSHFNFYIDSDELDALSVSDIRDLVLCTKHAGK